MAAAAYEWEGLHPEDADIEVGSRDPRQYPFGYRANSAPTPWEPRFLWFRATEEMARFLIDYGPEVCQDYDKIDTRNALKMLLAASEDDLQLTESLRERVNVATGPALELVWWGSFESLCAGRGEFATAALQGFRKQQGDLAPVTKEETDDFLDFLSELVLRLPSSQQGL